MKQAFQGQRTDETQRMAEKTNSFPTPISSPTITFTYIPIEEPLSVPCINLLEDITHAMCSRLKSYQAIKKDKSMT